MRRVHHSEEIVKKAITEYEFSIPREQYSELGTMPDGIGN
jgi:hypothetical protein